VSAFPYYFTWGLQPTQDVFPVERAEHDEFVLRGGRRVYDFISTSFQASFGHSHPVIREAIARQLHSMPIASPKAAFELKQQVSQQLLELLGLGDGKLFYTVSGAESAENALKMARQVTGRTIIAARRKSYHGASLGALSVTGDWRNLPHFTVDEQTLRIPEPDEDPGFEQTAALLRAAGPKKIAAVIVETISGTNGVAIPERQWFAAMQRTCAELDVLLIIDEVLCGFGRTGPPFAFQDFGVVPDLVCLSKGITGGYIPFGAVWTGPRIARYYDQQKMTCGLTSYAHPLGLAALGAVLEIMADSDFLKNKAELESVFGQTVQTWSGLPGIGPVRCRGLLAAVELADGHLPDWQVFFDHGLHVFSNPSMLILGPPFISSPARLRAALAVVQELLEHRK
jgi:taurine--2-oxoglutarate transaminase